MWGLPLKDAEVLKQGITKISIKMKLIILNHPCLKASNPFVTIKNLIQWDNNTPKYNGS